ncbi:MAG TPA: YchJ family metal-binding protein [Ottowia sp.]|uniref:YchJ family protein n=1 Tax=Ottowia sp. TaxID=1898956 RepID=UPI002C52498A|nr:YchJ family metal-binding protein [Ottowia sp.]HMN21756.1 YchJ family metal-binding protein [Ottowia sp.]
MKPSRVRAAACPCGGRPAGASHEDCCGRYLDDVADTPAPDAEALMRSRYSAFARGDAAYLLETWHPSHRPATLELEPGTRWLGLEVIRHDVQDASHATVEFVARSRRGGGAAQRLHERSRFVRELVAGQWRWFYLDGDLL